MDNPRQVVFSSLEVTREGLLPYVSGVALKALGPEWETHVASAFRHWRAGPDGRYHFDTQKLLQVMDRFWNELFRSSLDRSHRSIVNELVDVRNRVAHDATISDEDAERALDSMRRLLIAVGATEASAKISSAREAILRARYGHSEAPWESNFQQGSVAQREKPPHLADEERNQDSEYDAGSGGELPRLIGEIAITQGNIDHNHLYLRSIFDRFPSDAKGGSNKAFAAKRTLTVSWGGPEAVQTDLDGEKKFFRARGWIGAFYKLNNARAGDRVRIEETAPYRYRVTLVR